MLKISTPKLLITSTVFSVGLIIEARPDFNALADSAALIPPSRIAVRNSARSCTSPPSCLTTGPALGIATTRSLRDVEVWFSTALRKLIDSASSLVFKLNALCRDRVADIASCLSTSPRIARRVVSATDSSNSFPVLPVAAISAANPIVSFAAAPKDDANSLAKLAV